MDHQGSLLERSIGTGQDGRGGRELASNLLHLLAQQNELGGEADTFGGVVISDDSMQRFIIFNYYNEANLTKYHALNKRRARELMSLVLYLGLPDPLWVRSTYLLPIPRTFPPGFLPPLPELDKSLTFTQPQAIPPVIEGEGQWEKFIASWAHVSSRDNPPGGIKFGSFARLELTLKRDFAGFHEFRGATERRGRRNRSIVEGSLICEECGKEAKDGVVLQRRSGCHMDQYCSAACQKKAWPYHNFFCATYRKRQAVA